VAATFLLGSAPAQALITPPVTVDGPSAAIGDFGGVAMATDGTGGLVYVKSVGGVPHVFASRFAEGRWGPPIQVDSSLPYEGSEPRIAAGPKGELLVVWVTQVATVKGKVRYGLYSARIAGTSASFGPPLPIDANVGEGVGVDPDITATGQGKAIVAYRAIVNTFGPTSLFTTAVQLRPGDVLAEIRVARLNGDRWSQLGAINNNPEASVRPPSPTNGPQVGVGAEGGAVVAWQEPDTTGAARIYMRRIFGTTPGPALQASPSNWEGNPVTADADALSLSVTPYAMGRVAFRIANVPGSALAGRLLVDTLPPNFSTEAAKLTGPQPVGLVAGEEPGAPTLATVEDSKRTATTTVAYVAGSRLRELSGSGLGPPSPIAVPGAPPAQPGSVPVVAADPEGGGLVAYPALAPSGLPAVAVRQEFANHALQSALLSGSQGGPVSELAIGRSGGGDGLVGFRQGEAGRYQIVADHLSVPPAPFKVSAPKGWIKPNAAKLSWEAAPSAVGGLTYAVLVNGRAVKSGLRRRRFRPRPVQLGDGVLRTQVLATDALGQQVLSAVARLRVDAAPPTVRVSVRRGRVKVRVRDEQSGVEGKATRVSFGDGERDRGGSAFSHGYARPGRYRVLVWASDRVGNRVERGFEVRVR
jgi:hypothetical protein